MRIGCAVLTSALGITLEDFSSLPALTIITAACKLTALPFVGLAPSHIREADAGTGAPGEQKRSKAGALGLAMALVAGVLWSIGTALWKLATVEPS